MDAELWISIDEAARQLETSEGHIKQLLEVSFLRGKQFAGETLIEKKSLLRWKKRQTAPQVDVTKVYSGIRQIFLANYDTVYGKEQAQHHGTRGSLYEQLLRDFLGEFLPQCFYLGSGQVLASSSALDKDGLPYRLSQQMDIVIFDALNHPLLLPKYELFPLEGTLAVIQVKSILDKRELFKAFDNVASAKSLKSEEATTVLCVPIQVHVEAEAKTYDLRDMPASLGVIFALESSVPPQDLLQHWRSWNTSHGVDSRTDMICVLREKPRTGKAPSRRKRGVQLSDEREKGILLVNTRRFERLRDFHQHMADDPIANCRKMQTSRLNNAEKGLSGEDEPIWSQMGLKPIRKEKLVSIKTPDVLLFFFSLLLRDLRKMSAFSRHLTKTTPLSYLRESGDYEALSVDET